MDHLYKILYFKPCLKFWFSCSETQLVLGSCYYEAFFNSVSGFIWLEKKIHRLQIFLFICIELSSWNAKLKYICISAGQEGVRNLCNSRDTKQYTHHHNLVQFTVLHMYALSGYYSWIRQMTAPKNSKLKETKVIMAGRFSARTGRSKGKPGVPFSHYRSVAPQRVKGKYAFTNNYLRQGLMILSCIPWLLYCQIRLCCLLAAERGLRKQIFHFIQIKNSPEVLFPMEVLLRGKTLFWGRNKEAELCVIQLSKDTWSSSSSAHCCRVLQQPMQSSWGHSGMLSHALISPTPLGFPRRWKFLAKKPQNRWSTETADESN